MQMGFSAVEINQWDKVGQTEISFLLFKLKYQLSFLSHQPSEHALLDYEPVFSLIIIL